MSSAAIEGEAAPGEAGQPEAAERVDRQLARHSTAARPHFAAAGLLGLAGAALTVAQAALLAHVIARAAVGHVTLASLQRPLIWLVAVVVARALLAGCFELSGRLAALRVMADLREQLARRLLIERPGRLVDERTGELATAAVQGIDALESYFAGYLPSLVLAVAVPVAVLIWITPLDPITAVILAVTIPILIGFMILIGVGAQSRTRRRWQALSLLSSHFLDVVRGLETLRAHRREGAQVEALTEVGERYRAETMGTLRLAFLSALVLELCAMIGTALVAATIGVQLTGGHLTLAAGLTVLLLAPELYGPLRAVGQQFHASADGLAAAGRVLRVLSEPVGLEDPAAPLPAPDPAWAPICLDAVTLVFPGRDAAVLDGLDLTLEPGELLAVTGVSGAGKSTLAALLLRLLDPTAGSVSCGGVDLRELAAADWRRRTAWVTQRAQLFSGSVAENVALADPAALDTAAGRGRLSDAVSAAGLDGLVTTLRDGLETAIGDGGRRLSAGEGQRVALARAFFADASLVVLDEPTANLDADTAAALGDAIVRLSAGRTVLLITHDLELAARADRVLELRDGRLRERARAWPVGVAA